MKQLIALLGIMSLLLLGSAALAEDVVIGLDENGQEIAEDDGDDVEQEVFEGTDLSLGNEGVEVQSLQSKLSKLGYYTGKISGKYGETTKKAVKAFQADFELEVTGVADAETQMLLFSAEYRPLKYGSSGEDVKRLQKRLSLLGYYTGKISGNYLTGSENGIKAFQEKMGLDVTGVADVGTLALLFSDQAISRAGSTPAPAATPAPEGGVPDGGESVLVVGDEPAPSPTVAFGKKLSYKSSGKQVKLLQQRLAELGYYTGNISGNFLGNTRNAVKAFQKQNGLAADGVVGAETWDLLFNTPDVVRPGDTPRPTATPEPIPFHIVVDVTNQVVTVYGRDEAGEYTEVIRQMICSTGTKKNPSDVGDWVLNGRKTKWCYFPTWGDYARYWTRINSSIAFHSVIYNSVSVMDLSVKSYKNLGTRASHGCVRLTVADAKWIYDNVPKGVVVTITEKLPPDPELRDSVKIPALNRNTMLPYATPQPTAEPVYVSGAMPPLPLATLKKNDSSEAVFWMQKKLTELGFYSGKCSGTFLDGTLAAVKAFQSANGMKATGTADVATLERLYAAELNPETPTPAPTATPAPTPAPTPVATIALTE